MRSRGEVRSTWGRWVLSVLMLMLCLPLSGLAKSPVGGYLAVFVPSAGEGWQPVSLTRLNATPGARIAELDGVSDWRLVYLDANGETIGDLAVPDPGAARQGAEGARLPLTLRFADWPGTVLVRVLDASRRPVVEIPLDAVAREAAGRAAARSERLRSLAALRRAPDDATVRAGAAAARDSLDRQLAAAHSRGARGRRCNGAAAAWSPPEMIRPAYSCAASGSTPAFSLGPPMPARARAALPTGARPAATGSPARQSAPNAATVTLQGRIRFPAGAVAPDAGFWLDVFGAQGDPAQRDQVFVSPPDFTYSHPVLEDAAISLRAYNPPVPFLPAERAVGVVQAGSTHDLTLEQGVVYSGRIRIPEGAEPPDYSYFFLLGQDEDGNELPARSVFANPPDFEFAVAVGVGWNIDAFVPSATPFVSSRLPLGIVGAAFTRDIALERGAVVRGRVLPPPGGPALNGTVYLQLSGIDGNTFLSATGPEFRYEFLARLGAAPTVTLTAPSPYLADELSFGPLAGDLVRDIRLQRGVGLTHRLRSNGTLPGQATWQMLDLLSGQVRQLPLSGTSDFVMPVPPRGAVVEVFAPGMRASHGFTPSGGNDQEAEFRLDPLQGTANVVLDLRRPSGSPMEEARVEVWRDGRYLTGVLSDIMGIARLDLADGNYRVKVWPDTEEIARYHSNETLLFADAAIDVPLAVAGQTQRTLQAEAGNWFNMMVALPDEAPWPGCAEKHGRLELLRGGQVVARGRFRSLPIQEGFGHTLTVGAGTYRLRYRMPGGVSYTSGSFLARQAGRIVLERDGAAPQNLWTGVLRDHLGNPVAGRQITVSDELGITTQPFFCPIATDADGRFRLPICEGCVFEFPAAVGSPAQRRIVHIDGPVSGSRVEDLQLGAPLPFAPLADQGVSRVYGRGDEPMKLVFLAEGYAAERETFTDSNGNGVWDGVQLVDLNGNGVYDGGEPYALYGNATDPVEGQAPGSISEVIQDRNGDGVLSLDDRALFERNVQDYLRGLFSSHQFSSFRNAYQASAVMSYSRQAGMDHGPGWQRDTAYGAAYVPNRGLIEIDYSLAGVAAAEASPDHTVVVVMINQPVPYGRVNSFILAGGGVLANGINGNVAAHEFGHNPGRLSDEYAEFSGTYTDGSDRWFQNSTRFVDRDKVAWGGDVPVPFDGRPTRPWMAESGFYEGSGYYSAGKFRPSPASMMRYMDSLLFNRTSVRQLQRVHARVLRGRTGLLSIDERQAGCRGYVATWNVASLGVSDVVLRADGPTGAVLAQGAATGSANLKSFRGDVYLVDAGNGAVLDIEAEPLLRCTQSTPKPPVQSRPPMAPPARPPATAPPRRLPEQGRIPAPRGPVHPPRADRAPEREASRR